MNLKLRDTWCLKLSMKHVENLPKTHTLPLFGPWFVAKDQKSDHFLAHAPLDS